MLANLIAKNIALIAHGSLSALNTVIVLDTVGASKGHNVTDWGIISKPTLQVTRDQCRDGALFQFRVEPDILGSGLSLPTYYGIELGYIPMFYTGPGSLLDDTQLVGGSRLWSKILLDVMT